VLGRAADGACVCHFSAAPTVRPRAPPRFRWRSPTGNFPWTATAHARAHGSVRHVQTGRPGTPLGGFLSSQHPASADPMPKVRNIVLRDGSDLTPCNGCGTLGLTRVDDEGLGGMPTEVNGTEYFSTTEVAERACVSRQTIWRWRKSGVIPPGRRYRNGQVLFTEEEADAIEAHANRLEPLDSGFQTHPTLF